MKSNCGRFLLFVFSLISVRTFAVGESTHTAISNCAEKLILSAAKRNVAKVYGNRPESGGKCALGVRQSLELSGVGDVQEGLGNAIDYLKTLKPHGFVTSGLVDPATAPAGSVIVFAGPDTNQYLGNGHYGTPPGNWLGHVTIKGDDGFYYTDGRTAEPATGWENNVDVEKIRTVASILIPDSELINEFASRCTGTPLAGFYLKELHAISFSAWIPVSNVFKWMDLAVAPSMAHAESSAAIPAPASVPTASSGSSSGTVSTSALPCATCAVLDQQILGLQSLHAAKASDRILGHRMARSVMRSLKAGGNENVTSDPVETFRHLLPLARNEMPFDEEGQMSQHLARLMKNDERLVTEWNQYIEALRSEDSEPCKTQLLVTSVHEAQCFTGLGATGQDASEPAGCVSTFNYVACESARR